LRETIAIVILLAAVLLAAGCTQSSTAGQDASQGTIRTHYDYKEGWGFTQGCYGKVTGYVYNAGNESVENVQLNFNMINARTGTIRDSKSIFLGTLEAGRSRTYEAILDGECTEDYRIEAVFGK
jgi:hypothetical protein